MKNRKRVTEKSKSRAARKQAKPARRVRIQVPVSAGMVALINRACAILKMSREEFVSQAVQRKIGSGRITGSTATGKRGCDYTKSTCEIRVQRINETPGSFKVDSPYKAARYWRKKISVMPWYDPEREQAVAVALNTHYDLIGHSLVSIGTLNESLAHPRDVFRSAIAVNAYGIFFMHNHPSSGPSPSKRDILLTKRLVQAANLLGIDFLDHVIIDSSAESDAGYYSFLETGQLVREEGQGNRRASRPMANRKTRQARLQLQ
jgi:DNA repair protein RadC